MNRRKALIFAGTTIVGSTISLTGCGGGGSDTNYVNTHTPNPILEIKDSIMSTSSTNTSPTFITSTPLLTTTQFSVATAYWALFGRTPNAPDLAYWVGVLGENASVTTAVDTLSSAVNGSLVLDKDPVTWIAALYYHLLNKMPEEDTVGQAYWVSALASSTYGTVVEQLITAALPVQSYAGDTFRNRRLVMEAVCRVQNSQNYSLSTQDSRSVLLRVNGDIASYNSCLTDVKRLLINRVASVPNSWGQVLTAATLFSGSTLPTNAPTRQYRNLVWYNRAGNMMLATAYLPPNFDSVSAHRTIIALHGGGWRQGYPEKIYNYCTSLASGSDPSYVVLAPTYRLTTYGFGSIDLQQDVDDFYTLVNNTTFIKRLSGKVSLFGESAGAHLACLIGATKNVHRVFGLYPPINLTGNPAVSVNLSPFCGYYNTNTAQQIATSADEQWTTGRTTRFQLWHGLSDTFVPHTQTGLMVTKAGAYCVARYRSGEGHGFTAPVRAEVLSAAVRFFDDRQVLDI